MLLMDFNKEVHFIIIVFVIALVNNLFWVTYKHLSVNISKQTIDIILIITLGIGTKNNLTNVYQTSV